MSLITAPPIHVHSFFSFSHSARACRFGNARFSRSTKDAAVAELVNADAENLDGTRVSLHEIPREHLFL
jgi:hypothetical protein